MARLRDDSARLENLRDEDRNLTALFDASYDDLDDIEQRLFRLLGVVPGPDVDAYAAAHLIDRDLRTAEQLLESLREHNLLIEREPGRYRLHDLLRAYARKRAEHSSVQEADTALTSLLDYYRHTALVAREALSFRTRSGLGSITTDGRCEPSPDFPEQDRAFAWLHAERANLLAAIELTGIAPAYRIHLTAALSTFLKQQGPWSLAIQLHDAAAELSQAVGEGLSLGDALLDLGDIQLSLGRMDEGMESCERALSVFRNLDDVQGTSPTGPR